MATASRAYLRQHKPQLGVSFTAKLPLLRRMPAPAPWPPKAACLRPQGRHRHHPASRCASTTSGWPRPWRADLTARDPLKADDVLISRLISSPLHEPAWYLVTDGSVPSCCARRTRPEILPRTRSVPASRLTAPAPGRQKPETAPIHVLQPARRGPGRFLMRVIRQGGGLPPCRAMPVITRPHGGTATRRSSSSGTSRRSSGWSSAWPSLAPIVNTFFISSACKKLAFLLELPCARSAGEGHGDAV
jgi:hypothetical protein